MANRKSHIEFRCVEVVQPIGSFYVGSISHQDLLAISYADVRRLESRDLEKYLGIQRPLNPGRVSELEKYVGLVDATFPTSVILAIEQGDAEFEEKTGLMRVKRSPSVAKIIDGQHRIAGLEGYESGTFQLNVTIFIDMDIEDQAMVFSTINIKHTKVSKSLMYDLFEFAKSRSPQKTCHTIARLANKRDSSPFKGKIKILGVASSTDETITQAALVDRLMVYISRDPMTDRDMIRRGKKLHHVDSNEDKQLVFRNLFIDDEDAKIFKILTNFFGAVQDQWPTAWNDVEVGSILNRTTGLTALMKLLRPAYNHLRKPKSPLVSKDEFASLLAMCTLRDSDFNKEKYVPGGSGQRSLFRDLVEQTGLS